MKFVLPIVLIGIFAVGAAKAAVTYEPVALTGVSGDDPRGPQLGIGVSFSGFGAAGSDVKSINSSGQIAFTAQLLYPDATHEHSYWSGTPGSLQLLGLQTDHAPGAEAEVNFGSFFGPNVNSAGQVAFFADLTGPGGDAGVYSGPSDSPQLVARTQHGAPGTGPNVDFLNLSILRISSSGVVALDAQLSGMGVNTSNNRGIWAGSPGSLQLVMRGGNPAPGAGAGVNFQPNFTAPLINSDGNVAFIGLLIGPGIGQSNDRGVWMGPPGSIQLVAYEGDVAPDTEPGVSIADIFGLDINGAGQLAFQATLGGTGIVSSNDSGIWTGPAGALQLVAREGAPAPGTPMDVNFGALNAPPSLNSSGRVAFLGFLAGTNVNGTNDRGLWAGQPGSLQLVAREGNAAPGAGEGISFISFGTNPALNSSGQVAFESVLTGNQNSIWLTDAGGVPTLIARVGQTFDVDFGPSIDSRIVNSVDIDFGLNLGSGNESGLPSALSDNGQLVFRLSFTDGSNGIFVAEATAPITNPGDFNGDNSVDAADYVVWRKNEGTGISLPNDPHGGIIGVAQYNTWRAHFGNTIGSGAGALADSVAVPEPNAALLLALGVAGGRWRVTRRAKHLG